MINIFSFRSDFLFLVWRICFNFLFSVSFSKRLKTFSERHLIFFTQINLHRCKASSHLEEKESKTAWNDRLPYMPSVYLFKINVPVFIAVAFNRMNMWRSFHLVSQILIFPRLFLLPSISRFLLIFFSYSLYLWKKT